MKKNKLQIKEIKLIKTGDCGLISSSSWLAKRIQYFQKCIWNHAFIFWWNYDELFVVEADRRGICLTPFSDYINSNKKIMILKPKFRVDGSEYGSFMLKYCGKTRYGYGNLLLAQSIKFITAGRIWIGPSVNEKTKTFICGEFVAFVYNHFNKWLFEDWNRLAPSDIYNCIVFEHYLFEK